METETMETDVRNSETEEKEISEKMETHATHPDHDINMPWYELIFCWNNYNSRM